MHNDGTPMQVSVIKKDCFACSNAPHLYDYNNEFSPIPLTPKMLEANGFKHLKEMSYKGREFYAIPVEDLERKGFGVEYINEVEFCITDHTLMPFWFVHEFQQALRLCGLNHIADNFKVK